MPQSANLDFRVYPLRFHFTAIDLVSFPKGKAGNVFRGALGLALQEVGGVLDCLEPAPSPNRPSGLRDPPQPFVLRALRLDGKVFQPGDALHVDLHLFCAIAPITYLTKGFETFAQAGIGPRRGRVKLTEVTRIDAPECPIDSEPMSLSLVVSEIPCSRIHVDFLTPTELKSDTGLAERPEFHILFKRVRDRISTLRALYGPGPLAVDFHGLAERAKLVRLDRCSLSQVQVERRSSRTGQVHGIGGFIGQAEYSGDLAEFLPWLRAAEWTGVGRQTVWGKGFFRVRPFPLETD
jgi:hypothetical protein